MTKRILVLAAILLSMTGLAEAHPGHGVVGFASGFVHPFSGLDHIIAMVAVGFIAATLGGRAIWAVPTAFMSMMVVGGVWSMAALPLPLVEVGILASVIILSALAILRWNISLYAAIALSGFFAVFHGFAHGAEMPKDAAGFTFAVGFVVATALLHGAGLVIGILMAKSKALPQA